MLFVFGAGLLILVLEQSDLLTEKNATEKEILTV